MNAHTPLNPADSSPKQPVPSAEPENRALLLGYLPAMGIGHDRPWHHGPERQKCVCNGRSTLSVLNQRLSTSSVYVGKFRAFHLHVFLVACTYPFCLRVFRRCYVSGRPRLSLWAVVRGGSGLVMILFTDLGTRSCLGWSIIRRRRFKYSLKVRCLLLP